MKAVRIALWTLGGALVLLGVISLAAKLLQNLTREQLQAVRVLTEYFQVGAALPTATRVKLFLALNWAWFLAVGVLLQGAALWLTLAGRRKR